MFAIGDVAILTDRVDSGAYGPKLKERMKKEGNEPVTNCHGLKMSAADGRRRMTDFADTEQLLRLTPSVPSPKAEPFECRLSKVAWNERRTITALHSPKSGFSLKPFDAMFVPRTEQQRFQCKPSKTAASPSRTPFLPHWPRAKRLRSVTHPASSLSSSPRLSMALHAPAASPRASLPSRTTSTRPTRRSRRCSTENPDLGLGRTASNCDPQYEAAFLIRKDLLLSFNPHPSCERRQQKSITLRLARKSSE